MRSEARAANGSKNSSRPAALQFFCWSPTDWMFLLIGVRCYCRLAIGCLVDWPLYVFVDLPLNVIVDWPFDVLLIGRWLFSLIGH